MSAANETLRPKTGATPREAAAPAASPAAAQQSLPVYGAALFYVTDGVAEGDAVSFADELVLDDIYTLAETATRVPLALSVGTGDGALSVAQDSALGGVGNDIHLDCCLTLMAADGTTSEALVLVEVEENAAAAVYLLPLGHLRPGAQYRLVGIDRHAATTRLAQAASVAFTRGTCITMASGQQRPIEALSVGDLVLTRDDGPQKIRWIGQSTLRAEGAFAPVLIRKGALHNANDLIVSPDHRLFIYQRTDALGAGRAEVLVKVRHLINGSTVVQQDGGFVDYFQILFDEHQIIFAEGIAAESLLLDPRTRAAVPEDVSQGVSGHGHTARAHHGYEIKETLLSKPDTVDLLRRASSSS